MLEKPDLPDEALVQCVRERCGFPAISVDFLPVGNDPAAWAYRVRLEAGDSCFLKMRKGVVYEPSAVLPRYLKDQGLMEVVAPLRTTAGALWQRLGDFTLLLYPFIEGSTGMETGLKNHQWRRYGAFLRELHGARLPPELLARLPEETFVPRWAETVRALQARVRAEAFCDPSRKGLAAFWRSKGEEIERIVRRAEGLGRLLQTQPYERALCHADIHTANLLFDAAGRMFVVDWDGLLLAPKERDLMFVVGTPAAGFEIGPSDRGVVFRGLRGNGG